MFISKILGDFVTFADELPAYVTLPQNRLCGPQSPIDKIPSSPLQHDEKVLPGSEVMIRDIQNNAQQIVRSGPQFPIDKVPSLPESRDEKTFPKVSRTKVLRLVNC